MFLIDDLRSWRTLNDFLKTADEEDMERALKCEKGGEARLQFLNRIHGAYNKARYARERMEIAKIAKRN